MRVSSKNFVEDTLELIYVQVNSRSGVIGIEKKHGWHHGKLVPKIIVDYLGDFLLQNERKGDSGKLIKMKRTYIKEAKVNEKNKFQGFVENIRNKKTMAFIVLKDISGKIQLTIEKEKFPEIAEKIEGLLPHSVISVEGMVVENEFVKMGGKEMLPDTLEVESYAEALPMGADANIDTRLDYRWVDLRTEKML